MLSKSIPPIRRKTRDLRTTPLQKLCSQPPDPDPDWWFLLVLRCLLVFRGHMFDRESSFSDLFVRELESVKRLKLFLELGLFGLLGLLLSLLGFHLGLHLGLLVLLKLDLSRWKWRAENAIKAVLERNWVAAISYLIAKKKKNYPFVAVDGVPVMAGTNRMFTAGSAGYHIRELYPAFINGCVLMVDDAQGMIGEKSTFNIVIMDSGAPDHYTGNESLFYEYAEAKDASQINGVGGGKIDVLGSGTIRDGRFHMKDVKYAPGLNPHEDIKKTIFSVGKLAEDGYNINFDEAGGCTVIDTRSRVWSWARLTWSHEIVGKGRKINSHYHMDFLRMRASVPSPEGIGVVKSLCKAAFAGWSTITGRLHSQGSTAQRPAV